MRLSPMYQLSCREKAFISRKVDEAKIDVMSASTEICTPAGCEAARAPPTAAKQAAARQRRLVVLIIGTV